MFAYCIECGELTLYVCGDCERGFEDEYALCWRAECREKHDSSHVAQRRLADGENPNTVVVLRTDGPSSSYNSDLYVEWPIPA